jgi:hypothetical protein
VVTSLQVQKVNAHSTQLHLLRQHHARVEPLVPVPPQVEATCNSHTTVNF